MKKLLMYLFIPFFILLLNFSCNKNDNNSICYQAKILKISCGGSVLQLLTEKKIGEEWHDFDNNSIYQNCVLAGIIPSENKIVGDTINIEFNKVTTFSSGNFCDIGGLPSTKIEIKNLYSTSCAN